jgi:hypothetical protein
MMMMMMTTTTTTRMRKVIFYNERTSGVSCDWHNFPNLESSPANETCNMRDVPDVCVFCAQRGLFRFFLVC